MRKWLLAGLGTLVFMTGLQAEELAIGKEINPLTCLHRKRCGKRKNHCDPRGNFIPIPGPMGFPGLPGVPGPAGPTGPTGTAGTAGSFATALSSSYTVGTQVFTLPLAIFFTSEQFPPIGITHVAGSQTFVVPINGIYRITWTGSIDANPDDQIININLLVDGSAISPSPFQTFTIEGLSVGPTFSGQTLLNLTAGQSLALQLEILTVAITTLRDPSLTITLLAPTG